MKVLRHQKEWSNLLADHYVDLVRIARKWTDHPRDLVHHTYLRVIDKPHMRNARSYFIKAMYREATIGKFAEQYRITDNVIDELLVENSSLDTSIMREHLQMAIDHMQWFDRQVIMLHLQGWNMADVARRSGININVLYKSLHVTKKTLHEILGQSERKK